MANDINKINVNSGHEIDDQLIEKLFPKCRPKNKSSIACNDINHNYRNRNRDQILIDLDLINDNNTMNETKDRDKCLQMADNSCNNSVKSSLSNIGFKLDQLLLSPEEEEYKPLNRNFINNKPFIDANEDIDESEDQMNGKDISLRESRIEIAGGREIFSASKHKLNKKRLLSHNQNNDKLLANIKIKSKRNNTTQTLALNQNNKTIQNKDISVDSDPNVHSMATNSSVNQLLNSPICDLLTDLSKSVEQKHKLLSGIVVYEDFNSGELDSEIIYDDIEEIDRRELQLSVKPISSETQDSVIEDTNDLVIETPISINSINKYEEYKNCSEISNECEEQITCFDEQISVEDIESRGIARIIGNVPIAQYDGSPRRYGPKPPGYPQRVTTDMTTSAIESKDLVDISCDELVKSILSIPTPLEDSPTNSSMNASNDSKSHSSGTQSVPNSDSDKNDVLMETSDINVYQFSDLDYKLYRMDGVVGNSYVGKRLATLSSVNSEDGSPSKSLNNDSNTSMIAHENELILLHERVRQHIINEIVSTDRSPVSVGEGTQPDPEGIVESNRNFNLSPDITDCDSNEIESELSLEGSLLSNSKIVSMPVLEDGLSSGLPSSDNEMEDEVNCDSDSGNRYNKKQICGEELVSKLKSKLKRNDNLFDHKIIGFTGSQNRNIKNDSNICQNSCVKIESKSVMNESRDEQMCRQNKDSDGNESHESIWIPRDNETNGSKAVNETNDESNDCEPHVPRHPDEDCDTDQETDRLLGAQRSDDRGFFDEKERLNFRLTSMSTIFRLNSRNNDFIRIDTYFDDKNSTKRSNATREAVIHDPSVLIEGVLFRARYLGSTQLVCEGQPTKATRMMQAEEAVSRIKTLAPEGETQPSTDVDLFISTEKIMVLNTDLKEIMMDHSLRTISYIADIGDLLVLMARRRILNPMEDSNESSIKRIPKMICHVFESEEAQFIAQSIGQAFQVAYMEFLKANGIEDSSFVKEMDYQEVLNSQEIFGNELEMFAKKEKQKEVIVPKQKGEILGVVIVESGWGSMLPTVVIANMAQSGPSARCGQLNIGDQIIAINGVSLVGLPLSTCQAYIKNTKNQTVVKFTVVPCPPVVEVKIKRPDTKYQLGFSVQNGVICSLLRGGIAERGGVRVGHRIIEINGQSVVAVPHDRIVNLLATSVGEILMKTMPTSMFRLLTGQEMPTYM